MKTKLIAALALTGLMSTTGQAAWDAKFMPQPEAKNYMSDYYLAVGDWRTVKQLESFDQPNANGHIYIENVAEFDCASQSFKIVESKGFASWNDYLGQNLKVVDTWKPVEQNTKEHVVLNKLCSTKVADAKDRIAK